MRNFEKYLQEYADSAVRQRGKQVFENRRLQLVNFENGKLDLKVKGSGASTWYDVKIQLTSDSKEVETSCTCPYDWGGICKHSVAGILYLEDYLERNPSIGGSSTGKVFNQSDVTIKLNQFSEEAILSLVSRHHYQAVRYIARNHRCKVHRGNDGNVAFDLNYRDLEYKIGFTVSDEKVHSSCSCAEEITDPICIHKAGALLQFFYEDGEYALIMLKNYDEEKDILLKGYGYSITDKNIEDKFRFRLVNGKMTIQPTDSSIVRIDGGSLADLLNFGKNGFSIPKRATQSILKDEKEQFGLGYFFKFFENSTLLPVEITPFKGKLSKDSQKFASHLSELHQLDLGDVSLLASDDHKIFEVLENVESRNLVDYLGTIGFKPNKYSWGGYTLADFPNGAEQAVYQYQIDTIGTALRTIKDKKVYYASDNNFRISSLRKLQIANGYLQPHFELRDEATDIVLEATLRLGEDIISSKHILHVYAFGVLLADGQLLPIESVKDFQAIALASVKPIMRVRNIGREGFVKQVVLPLMQHYPIELNTKVELQDVDGLEPEAKLYLAESEGFLSLTPVFEYESRQITHDQHQDLLYEEEGVYYRLKRDYDYEEEMVSILAGSHEQFIQEGPTFYLDANQVLEDNWFFEIFDYLREKGFELFGFKDLKNFRYSPFKPETKFEVSSGIDWFDCQITVQFGDQFVSLKEIRKAVLSNENYVKLGDGTLGVLPKEWIQKYGMLLKLGNINKDGMQLSKLHFSVVDELYAEIDNEGVLREIEEKKRKLRDFDKIRAIKPSKEMTATLRDYQEAGLNWMHFLEEFRWGGCLADDMGLGKTLQTLAFIQSLADKDKNVCCLVVVPTSLLFNWVNEMDKFTPSLRYLLHHGTDRVPDINEFYKYNVVLTTYGVIVRDIDKIKELQLDYAILDESQAIKNVTSKRYKAVSLLKAKNKLVLTGTPVENNTFELYAQMNFLNPGILGTQEFFKKEYANPIDKKGEIAKVEELKKIVYPFILRRTKEQVAKDLPDKSENILICEMGTKQRKVYDAYKNHYRDKLLNLINEQGIEKSGMYILEGLLRLRQICDSPALLKDKDLNTEESVKLNELGTQVSELVGGHKVLIFSQFVGMLSLIRKQMERKGIEYSYLDGQTRNREEVVADFQTNESKRVFLISLKAGGVGLNLTAADYVFLVDPWWNPAVEQQAIDRTHRIGQVNKVFAYKMICKDTVEEKILKLQEKKKALVDDIISAEKSLLKSLTKEDVTELFS